MIMTFRKNYKNLDVLIKDAGVCLPEKSITVENRKILWEKSLE
jgi:NADP-dependent 3-hydroxy acid dehydrogenase YdfG